jgi:hypothetical protein
MEFRRLPSGLMNNCYVSISVPSAFVWSDGNLGQRNFSQLELILTHWLNLVKKILNQVSLPSLSPSPSATPAMPQHSQRGSIMTFRGELRSATVLSSLNLSYRRVAHDTITSGFHHIFKRCDANCLWIANHSN